MVTGINGFLGVHLAKALSKTGATVHGTSRNPQHMAYLDAARDAEAYPVHQLDIQNGIPVFELLKNEKFDCIFHLASQSDTWMSVQNPYETIRTNVFGTLNLLESARKLEKKPSIILAGTVRAFYGKGDHENGSVLHPYDASKMSMEAIATSYFQAHKIDGTIVKNTNLYGGNDLNFNRLIPTIMKQAFTEKQVRLKGDGSLSRDFMYVGDAVDGMLEAANHLSNPKINGKSVTLATEQLTSISEICQLIQETASFDIAFEFDKTQSLRERDQPTIDTHVAHEVLGWNSKTTLREGIAQTMEWYQHYFEAKK